jgi:hypothetical protein
VGGWGDREGGRFLTWDGPRFVFSEAGGLTPWGFSLFFVAPRFCMYTWSRAGTKNSNNNSDDDKLHMGGG